MLGSTGESTQFADYDRRSEATAEHLALEEIRRILAALDKAIESQRKLHISRARKLSLHKAKD